jgi:hypothetical protein
MTAPSLGRISLGIFWLKNHCGPSWFVQGRPPVKKTKELLHLFYADEGSVTIVTVAFEFDSDGLACDQILGNDLRVGNGQDAFVVQNDNVIDTVKCDHGARKFIGKSRGGGEYKAGDEKADHVGLQVETVKEMGLNWGRTSGRNG